MRLNKADAIIFDLDGVLVDTEPVHKKAELQACREYGFKPQADAWRAFKGIRERDIFIAVAKQAGVWPADVDELIRLKTDIYLRLIADDLPVIPGSADFVRFARARFSRIGLATSTTRIIAEATLKSLGVRDLFDLLITGEDVASGKPDPEIYRSACARLGLSPSSCLVIEDSDNGIRAAVGAGCPVVGITTSFPRDYLAAVGAQHVVDGYDELTAWLGLEDKDGQD